MVSTTETVIGPVPPQARNRAGFSYSEYRSHLIGCDTNAYFVAEVQWNDGVDLCAKIQIGCVECNA